MDQKTKIALIFGFFLLVLGFILLGYFISGTRSKIIFCDIGQGDGIIIVTKSGKQILIDGGGGRRILECLGKNLPFWDRKIDMMVATHDQKDHIESQIEVFLRYEIENVISTNISGDSSFSSEWQKSLENEKSRLHIPKAGEKIVVDNLVFEVLWPDNESYSLWRLAEPSDLNEASIVLRMNWQDRRGEVNCAYLTGDITSEILTKVVDRKCDLLKVSHHGSKTGTTDEILKKISPSVAVIQVGKNSYGHPHKDVLESLERSKLKILRNDTEGDIKIYLGNN